MATQREIAERCGVSVPTVSHVLNGRGHKVSAETRERVLQVIDELSYRPNVLALGLKRGWTNSVGWVAPNGIQATLDSNRTDWRIMVLRDWQEPIMRGVARAADESKQHLLLLSQSIWEDDPAALDPLLDRRCDGLLITSVPTDHAIYSMLKRAQVPFVLLSETTDDPEMSCIDVDNMKAGYELTRYVVEQGHRRIAFLCSDDSYRWCADRILGYKAALTESEVAYQRVLNLELRYMGGLRMDLVIELLQGDRGERPTALICSTDSIAIQTMELCAEAGLSVPDAVSISGFNDGQAGAIVQPGLTTVRLPLEAMGYRGLQVLYRLIRGEVPLGYKERMDTELIVRDSVAKVVGSST